MAEHLVLKQFDLEPAFEATLLDGDTPVNLSNAIAVTFYMTDLDFAAVTSGAMTVADQAVLANRGQATYAWVSGDTDTFGAFYAGVVVTWPGPRPQTFPGDQFVRVEIQRSLVPAVP